MRQPETLPSARVLDTMARDFDGSFIAFGRAQSEQIRRNFMRMPFAADAHSRLAALARQSIDEQKRIEDNDSMPFEIFRQAYLETRRLGV